jgi:type I restriction enzyme, S subunit
VNSFSLAEISEIVMGQSPPSSEYNSQGKGLPFFQGKTEFGDLHPTVKMFCTEPKKIAEVNDILISVRAPVGPTNINITKSCIGRGLAAIRCSKKVDLYYLLYFLRFHESKLAEMGQGSTFEAINKDDLEDIKIPLPPLEEQKRIAQIAGKCDRLRLTRRYTQQLSDT